MIPSSFPPRTRTAVVALILGWMILNGILATVDAGNPFEPAFRIYIGLVSGSLFSQLLVIMLVLSQGNQQSWARIMVSLLAAAGLTVLMTLLLTPDPSFRWTVYCVIIFGHWLIYQLVFWLLKYRGWRLINPLHRRPLKLSGKRQWQFDLRWIFAGTLVAAISMAIVRPLLPSLFQDLQLVRMAYVALYLALSLLCFALIPALSSVPLAIGALVETRAVLAAARAVAWAVLCGSIGAIAIRALGTDPTIYLVTLGSQLVITVLSMYVLRWAGFRGVLLQRQSADGSSPESTASRPP